MACGRRSSPSGAEHSLPGNSPCRFNQLIQAHPLPIPTKPDCQSQDPSRNGEDGKTQIGKAPGDDEGPPQADRDGTRAGMPVGSGSSEGKGGAAVTCRRNCVQAKQAQPGRVIPGGTPPRALSGGVG